MSRHIDTNAIHCFDLTVDASRVELETIKTWFDEIAKKYVFQLEKGEQTGYMHYQCRLSLYKKIRLSGFESMCIAAFEAGWGKASPTSTSGSKTFDYVMKEETRVEGPWMDKTAEANLPQKPYECWCPPEWNAMQRDITERVIPYQNQRTFTVYVGIIPETGKSVGNLGKTTIGMHLSMQRKCIRVPASLDSGEKIVKFVFGLADITVDRHVIILDVPRAVDSRKHWVKWLSALEDIKNGYLYDDRWSTRVKHIKPPVVIIFGNELPPLHLLTMDRWEIINPVLLMRQDKTMALPEELRVVNKGAEMLDRWRENYPKNGQLPGGSGLA
nr:MAG: replication associated protein [Arizlama virus]